jgi:Repeats of unknown function (DUF5649)
LVVTAKGITDSGTVKVAGDTTLTATTFSVVLDSLNNDFNKVSVVSANNVTLRDADDINLGGMTLTGNLGVTANGAVTNTGVLDIDGTTAITATGFNVTLNQANVLTGAVSATAADLTVNNTIDTVLGASTLTGALDVTSKGHVTQTGLLDVDGITKVTIDTTLAQDVLLGTTFANDLTGAVTIATASGGTVRDIALRNVSTSASLASIPTSGSVRDLTVVFNNASVVLPNTNISRDLVVTSGTGDITDAADVVVGRYTTLTAPTTKDIVLNGVANQFTDKVSIVSANNATINDINGIILGTSTVSGDLTLTANGAITDDIGAAITITGKTNLTAGVANNITLDNATNDFVGAVGVVSGLNVQLVDKNAILLGDVTTAGSLNVSAQGNITQTAPADNVVVGTTTTLNSGASGDIILANTTNDFTGNVTLTAAGGAINVQDINSLIVAALQSGTDKGVRLVAGTQLTLPNVNINTGTADLELRSQNGTLVVPVGKAYAGANVILEGDNGLTINGSVTSTADTKLIASDIATGTISQGGGGLLDVGGTLYTTSGAGTVLTNASNNIGNLQATNSTLGNITFTSKGDAINNLLTIHGATNTAVGGNITLTNNSINPGTLATANAR